MTVELVGTLKHNAGRGELSVTIPDRMDVISFIRDLEEEHGVPKDLLLEGHKEVRRNLLILVNGREIGVLNGLATLLSDGDRLTLLPVSHGG